MAAQELDQIKSVRRETRDETLSTGNEPCHPILPYFDDNRVACHAIRFVR
jgi:hypothetical protein